MKTHGVLGLAMLTMWASPVRAEKPGFIWVGRDVQGGRQCERSPEPRPDPDADQAKLKRAGINELTRFVENRPVCLACGCPEYSMGIYFRIPSRQAEVANRLGFAEVQPPEAAELHPDTCCRASWSARRGVSSRSAWTTCSSRS